MTDYTELVKALRREGMSKRCGTCTYGYRLCPDSECNDACNVEQFIADAAAAIEALQAQMPKRGEWIIITETSDDGAVQHHMNCSVCGFYWREPKHRKVFKRCPNCGAKMDGERKEGEG